MRIVKIQLKYLHMKKYIYLLIILNITLFGSASFGQTVTTDVATNIEQTTVTFNASAVGLDAGKNYIVRFYYDINSGVDGNDDNISSSVFTGGTSHSFTANETGLIIATTYHFIAHLELL